MSPAYHMHVLHSAARAWACTMLLAATQCRTVLRRYGTVYWRIIVCGMQCSAKRSIGIVCLDLHMMRDSNRGPIGKGHVPWPGLDGYIYCTSLYNLVKICREVDLQRIETGLVCKARDLPHGVRDPPGIRVIGVARRRERLQALRQEA